MSLSLFFAFYGLNDFTSIVPVIERAPLDLGLSQAAWTSFLIVACGLLIPNRWQRAAAMIATTDAFL